MKIASPHSGIDITLARSGYEYDVPTTSRRARRGVRKSLKPWKQASIFLEYLSEIGPQFEVANCQH